MSEMELMLQRQILDLQRQIESLRTNIVYPDVWQNWTPTFPTTGTMYITSATVDIARYCVVRKVCFLQLQFDGTLSGSTDFQFIIGGFPLSVAFIEPPIMTNAHSTGWGNKANLYFTSSSIYIKSEDYSNMPLGTGKYFRINVFGNLS